MGSVASPKKPTLESLAAEMRRLQERIEDMEDLIELRDAIVQYSRIEKVFQYDVRIWACLLVLLT